MSSKQEFTRERVVTFYVNQKKVNENTAKAKTVHHFMKGLSKSGIYNTLKNYDNRLTTVRSEGSGQTMKFMTKTKLNKLYKLVNHSDKYDYSSAARKFCCNRDLQFLQFCLQFLIKNAFIFNIKS